LILVGAVVTVIWDTWLQQQIGKIRARRARRERSGDVGAVEANDAASISVGDHPRGHPTEGLQRRTQASTSVELTTSERTETDASSSALRTDNDLQPATTVARTDTTTHGIPVKLGICIIAAFLSR
jgi:hypothetical protein